VCDTAQDPFDAFAKLADRIVQHFETAPSVGLGPSLKKCWTQMGRIGAGFAIGTERFDVNREYATDGAVSTVSWLKANTGMSGGAAAETLHIGRQMEELPGAAEACSAGKLGYQHMSLIARVADQVGSDVVREQQSTLLAAAEKLNANDFSLLTRKLRDIVDPDGALKDANKAYDQRQLHLSQSLDGVFFMDGRLDPESGAIVKTALDALMTPVAGDDRTAAQRRCDALTELARRQMHAGSLPQVHGVKPHLTVTVSAAALAGVAGAEPGSVRSAGPVPTETVRRLACDAALAVVVLDDEGEPLDAGRTTRTIPPAILRALAVRDGGCRWPGCDRPVEWTDGHHRHHWAQGGETKLRNLVLLCRQHHRKVHEGRWQLVQKADGSFAARDLHGQTVVTPLPAARSA
jgi:hypothetical protein